MEGIHVKLNVKTKLNFVIFALFDNKIPFKDKIVTMSLSLNHENEIMWFSGRIKYNEIVSLLVFSIWVRNYYWSYWRGRWIVGNIMGNKLKLPLNEETLMWNQWMNE